ncbi:MAG: hypothetical protein HONBIEJF_00710 [Fimbriimonadaceae bacterium]|nr:hypothetical protein [Fimbriimonadaceae bacterium]
MVSAQQHPLFDSLDIEDAKAKAHYDWRHHGISDGAGNGEFRNWGGTFVPATADEIASMLDRIQNVTGNQSANDRFRRCKENLSDTRFKGMHEFLVNRANNMKSVASYQYQNSDALLHVARNAQDLIFTCAYVYRVNGDAELRDRAKQELLNIASFPDWHPMYNTMHVPAEFATAASLGMQWLNAELSESEKQTIRGAIIDKALNPALEQYRSGDPLHWWQWSGLNINVVSNSGLILGALAVRDTEPGLSAEVLAHAKKSLAIGIDSYASDGGWIEGAGYWEYATNYLAMASDRMAAEVNDDLGIGLAAGLERTGDYRVYAGGLGEQTFNFGNVLSNNTACPALMWLAEKFSKPEYADYQLQRIANRRPQPLDMVWYTAPLSSMSEMNKTSIFTNVHQAFFRSGWTKDSMAAAVKGGDNTANHTHRDLGHFMIDALGVRWAEDLDSTIEDHNRGYRSSAQGHNTMVFAGLDQNPMAKAAIQHNRTTGAKPFAIVDLQMANAGNLRSWRRGMMSISDKAIVVQDEWRGNKKTSAVWQMHTKAAIEIENRNATLTLNGKKMKVVIRYPRNADWSVAPVEVPEGEQPVHGVQKLQINTTTKSGLNRLVVAFIPQDANAPKFTTIGAVSLDKWTTGGGF